MSLQKPSNPLNASDAKLLSDDANVQNKKVATDAWLQDAYEQIRQAATAGEYSLDLSFDANDVNLVDIVKQLDTVLGYTVTVQANMNLVGVEWRSAQRQASSPDSSSYTNYGYKAT